jgi:pimeloyl-CoA synthetase
MGGGEEYHQIRYLSYPDSHFYFFIQYHDPQSFKNLEEIWIQEIEKEHKEVSKTPISTKEDLREDAEAIKELQSKGMTMVTVKEAISILRNWSSVWQILEIKKSKKTILGIQRHLLVP